MLSGRFLESRRGNKLILVLVDQFTKWMECYPIPDQTAEVVCRDIVDNSISRFGIPQQIHSDQGRNFESGLFQQLCKLLEITKTRTTPYRPSSNGQVERYNRTVRCYVDGRQREWDEYLSILSMAIRNTVSQTTGFTPNFMVLGRAISTINPTPKEMAEYLQ